MTDVAVQYDDEPVEDQVAEETEAEEVDEVEEASEENQSEPPKPKDEPISFSDQQQQFINEKIVGKKVAQMREMERELQELRTRFKETEQKPEGAPSIPPIPDVWDSDYEQKLQARDEALVAKANWERDQYISQQQKEREQQEQSYRQQQEMYSKVLTYTERAKAIGISEQELQVAGTAVSQMGMADDLVNYILADDQGPAITTYLARNLQTIQDLQGMSPMQAAIHIATEIKPKVARNLKRKAPPEPTESVKGAGFPEGKRGPKGATFE